MALQIERATKEKIKLRMAIDGPTGGGKTYTALRFAHHLAGDGGKILVIDSERRSASKYVGEIPDGIKWEFDVINMPSFSPSLYTEAVILGGKGGYDVIIIDSLSHAWMGKDGALELVDRAGATAAGGKFAAWRNVTPLHDQMIDTILDAPAHIVATMRSKMEYAMSETEKGGRKRTEVVKLGMAPIQRAGVEYEFDIVIDMDATNIGNVSKSRCSAMSGASIFQPSPAFIDPLIEWLESGDVATWRPDKKPFFNKLRDDFGLEFTKSAIILKDAGYTDGYNPALASEMYDAVKAAMKLSRPKPPRKK